MYKVPQRHGSPNLKGNGSGNFPKKVPLELRCRGRLVREGRGLREGKGVLDRGQRACRQEGTLCVEGPEGSLGAQELWGHQGLQLARQTGAGACMARQLTDSRLIPDSLAFQGHQLGSGQNRIQSQDVCAQRHLCCLSSQCSWRVSNF